MVCSSVRSRCYLQSKGNTRRSLHQTLNGNDSLVCEANLGFKRELLGCLQTPWHVELAPKLYRTITHPTAFSSDLDNSLDKFPKKSFLLLQFPRRVGQSELGISWPIRNRHFLAPSLIGTEKRFLREIMNKKCLTAVWPLFGAIGCRTRGRSSGRWSL